MKERCLNPNHHAFRNYGGRGITICDRWKSFEAFLIDVGRRPSPRHSIDRVDNERGYEVGNVHWATWGEQARNKRSTRMLTFNGVTQCVRDWAHATGLPETALYQRLRYGWDTERLLATPLNRSRRKKQ